MKRGKSLKRCLCCNRLFSKRELGFSGRCKKCQGYIDLLRPRKMSYNTKKRKRHD